MIHIHRHVTRWLNLHSEKSCIARALQRVLTLFVDAVRRFRIRFYNRGVTHFVNNRYRKALAFFRAYLAMGGEANLYYRRATRFGTIGPTLSESNIEKIKAYFDDRFLQWQNGAIALPNYVGSGEAGSSWGGVLAERRVLFLFPEYIFNRSDHIKSDFEDHFVETAKDVGIQTDIYYTDEVSYVEFQHSRDRGIEELHKLSRHIRETHPDLIVFDANYFGQESTINPAFLATIRRESGVKIAALVGDAYTESQTPLADYWGEVSDLVLHSAPRSPFKQRSKFKDKVLLIPWPVNRRRFYPDKSFRYDVSFVGNYTSPLRPYWLSVAALTAERINAKALLRPHLRKLGAAVNFDEYERILRGSRIVLNFSTHVNGVKALTGRVWQSTASGVLVLEEENEPIQEFFVPYIHYVPFSTATELSLLLEFFHKHESYRQKIASQAAFWSALHFGNSAIWQRIFAAL